MTYTLYTLDNQFIEETCIWPYKFTGIVKYDNGLTQYFFAGAYHRLDGPAYESPSYPNNHKEWFSHGSHHRLDGPAVEYPDGRKTWYIDGKHVTEEQCNFLYSIMKLKNLV